MALTFTIEQQFYIPKGPSIRIGKITFDSSYPTGGEAITVANFNFSGGILALFLEPSLGGYVPVWDGTNSKIKVLYGDYDNVSDGPLIEVPNTTDLSAVVVRFIAFGY